MKRRRVIDASPAVPVGGVPALDEIGTDTNGLVDVKTRLPIHMHIHLSNLAARNQRSLAAELRVAVREHLEREAKR